MNEFSSFFRTPIPWCSSFLINFHFKTVKSFATRKTKVWKIDKVFFFFFFFCFLLCFSFFTLCQFSYLYFIGEFKVCVLWNIKWMLALKSFALLISVQYSIKSYFKNIKIINSNNNQLVDDSTMLEIKNSLCL